MATSEATARIRENALRSLKEVGPQIAAQLGIEAPNLDFFFRDKDYQQAQELTALAEFNARVLDALRQEPSPATEGGSDDPTTKNPKSRR